MGWSQAVYMELMGLEAYMEFKGFYLSSSPEQTKHSGDFAVKSFVIIDHIR